MVYDSFKVCLNNDVSDSDVIPHNAKSEGFEVGNNTTLLQIVGHHPTARAKKEYY